MTHKRDEIARAFRDVNGTPAGEKILGYLLDYCHVFQTSMPKNCDPHMTLFNEGQRSVGNEIVALLVNPPERFKADTLRKIAHQAEGNDDI